MCTQLNFREANEHSLYLGLPNVIGRNKRAIFGFLKDKLQDRITGWDKKLLSKGGKEILLKTVAQTLPNYAMSVFLLPLELCREIERLMCKFWWKTDSKKDKCIHWKSWENMSVKKSNGGMGFRCLRDFNLALLGNQSWRLILHSNTLVSKVFKARYYAQDSFLTAKLGSNPSYIWRSLMETQPILKQGVSCRIGNGRSVNVLEEPWLPCSQDPYIQTRNEALNHQKVSSLMLVQETGWDRDLILDMFNDRDASMILSIPLNTEEEDSWFWRHEKLGHYSVKSAYALIQQGKTISNGQDNSSFWRCLWNLKIPPKIKKLSVAGKF